MELITVLVVGFVAGLVARLFVPGNGHLGWFATLVVGVSGSLFGGFISKLFEGELQITASGLFGSVIGAVIVLMIYQTATARRQTAS